MFKSLIKKVIWGETHVIYEGKPTSLRDAMVNYCKENGDYLSKLRHELDTIHAHYREAYCMGCPCKPICKVTDTIKYGETCPKEVWGEEREDA